MEKNPFPNKTYRDSITINPFLSRQPSIETQNSIKKINVHEFNKRKSTFKSIPSSKFHQKSTTNFDFIKEKDFHKQESESSDDETKSFHLIKNQKMKPKSKGVRFRDRVSIQNRESMEIKKQNVLIDISNQEKISMLHNIVKNKNFNLPMTSRRRAPQNVKIVSDLMNSPVQSKSSVIQQLKCFMCHYPQQNSPLFGKKIMIEVKQRLQQISNVEAQQGTFFRYEAFGYFLKTLNDLNYDSHQVITAFETVLTKYTYPTSIKLMLYYLGSYLYQLNNHYDKSEDILRKLFGEMLKSKLFEYVGVYLVLMVKLKANLLEWDLCTRYLMKLLAYSWLFRFDNLEIWVYFELSRSYFFMNQNQQSEYFKVRSQMSVLEPKTNIYRDLVAKQFKSELIQMRTEHKPFDLERKISICELIKIDEHMDYEPKEKDDFKLQSQIKNINEHCKIKYVKNLLSRMNSDQAIKTSRNFSRENSLFGNKTSRQFAGNPLLRTHESGLKNLKIYFRNNPKGQSLLNKNRQPQLYTFQNSNKNILVLKELCRNVLLQMKWFIPINIHES